jgi:hypothetical protein
MSHSAHPLKSTERDRLKRLEASIETSASQVLPAGELERVYFARGTLLQGCDFLLETGTELATQIRTWLPVEGTAYIGAAADAAEMMRQVRDTAFMFDAVALPPCLLLRNPRLATWVGDDGSGPLEQTARRLLADDTCAREIIRAG